MKRNRYVSSVDITIEAMEAILQRLARTPDGEHAVEDGTHVIGAEYRLEDGAIRVYVEGISESVAWEGMTPARVAVIRYKDVKGSDRE